MPSSLRALAASAAAAISASLSPASSALSSTTSAAGLRRGEQLVLELRAERRLFLVERAQLRLVGVGRAARRRARNPCSSARPESSATRVELERRALVVDAPSRARTASAFEVDRVVSARRASARRPPARFCSVSLVFACVIAWNALFDARQQLAGLLERDDRVVERRRRRVGRRSSRPRRSARACLLRSPAGSRSSWILSNGGAWKGSVLAFANGFDGVKVMAVLGLLQAVSAAANTNATISRRRSITESSCEERVRTRLSRAQIFGSVIPVCDWYLPFLSL